ncbi:hypothetical protein ACFLQK_01125 [bacterium]
MIQETATFNISGICLVIGVLMVIPGALLLQKALHRELDAGEVFMSSVIIGFAWITVSSIFLGITGLTGLLYRMLADALFLAVAFMAYAKYFPLKKQIERNPGPMKSFPVMMVLGIGIVICSMLWIWGWVSPPPAWDAFVYHLEFPASWLRRGRIFLITVPFGDQAGTYFPSNMELIYLWLLTYTGQDFATNVTQWFFMIVCVAAVYRMSRLTGASQAVSLCASFSIFFMPSIVHQAVSSEVDVAFSAMFVASIYFLLRWRENPTIKFNLVLSMMAIGLFMGTKTIALPWTCLLYLPLLLVIAIKRGLRLWMFAGAAATILTGGFWYVRNFAVTGNPVFPLSLPIFGVELFNGAYTRETMINSVFHTDSFREWLNLLAGEWGIPLLILTLFSVLTVFVRYKRDRIHTICFGVLPLVILAICFWMVPYNREVRFTYTAFLLGAVSIGIIISRAGTGISRVLIMVPIIYVLNLIPFNHGHAEFYQHLATHMKNLLFPPHFIHEQMRTGAMIIGAAVLLTAFTVFFSLIRQDWISFSGRFIGISAILVFVGVVSISKNYPHYQYAYYARTPMGMSWNFLHQKPESLRVAYTGTDLSYGLVGPFLKNTVYHVPVNRHGFQYFHECNSHLKSTGEYAIPKTDRIDFCRRDPEFSMWFNKLVEMKTEILYVSVLHQNDRPHLPHDSENFPIERYWADSHPDLFKHIYLNRHVRIYEIIH